MRYHANELCINYIFYFRLLEEVSELEDSMRQLELKNENSEASLRDMQVIFIFSRNPRESLYRNNNVINHKTQKYFQNVLWVCLNIMNLCIDKENQACQIGYCSFIVWLGRKLQKLFVNLMHKKQFSFEATNFSYINYLHKSKEVAKCLHCAIYLPICYTHLSHCTLRVCSDLKK